ncbi:CopG family transcriptional regulator [Leptolyngbya sp. FACHB-17]|nr:CopG family transcriptional regulator [Leptolyngbya sp. FACHB-17]
MPPLETKQTTLRLEVEVSDRLQALCRENGICREVLIEAMFEYCEGNPDALRNVLGGAKKKNEYRQSIANQKRAKSMMERFGQGE